MKAINLWLRKMWETVECWGWNSNTLATWCRELNHWKRPWCWEELKAGGEGDNRGWDGWISSPTQWTWVWASSWSWWWTGSLVCFSPWGCTESDMTEQLNLTELNWNITVWEKISKSNKPLVRKKWEDRNYQYQ